MIFGILLLIGFGAAVDRAWQHLKADIAADRARAVKAREKELGRSPLSPSERRSVRRKHRTGYWGREVGGGFPVLRTGFHSGWLAHQAASSHAAARREDARLTALRTRASFLKAVGGYRTERQHLEAEIAAAVAASPPGRPTLAAVRERAGAVILQGPWKRPDETAAAGVPGDLGANEVRRDEAAAANWDEPLPEPGPYAPKPCAACGHPGTDDDPLVGAEGASWPIHYSHVTDPEDGFYGAATNDCTACGKPLGLRDHDGKSHLDCAEGAARLVPGHAYSIGYECRDIGDGVEAGSGEFTYCGPADFGKHEFAPADGGPPVYLFPDEITEAETVSRSQQSQPATGGTSMSETGYRQDVAACQSSAAHSEQGAADFRAMALAVEAMADGMGADEMDSATLAEAMDLAERYRAAAAAADACAEGSVSFGSSLQTRHEGVAEAVENAPVDHIAHKSYYENA